MGASSGNKQFATGPQRYRVLEELGRGGMGTVERVVDAVDGRVVALKRLFVASAKPEVRAKVVALFEREYHTLSQLHHPRIIQVFDYDVDAVGPYYTMEVLEGQDLKVHAPVDWVQVCQIGREVASSLAILHARGIVHRDVTPRNIRCGADGAWKLLDFGAMTPFGVVSEVVGTPPFIAPEAMEGSAIDGRADLFALGATLYYALSQRHAYPARSIAQLRDVWRSRVRSLKELCSDVPPGLNKLIMELLNTSPMARPQSAAVVFERLTTIGNLERDEAIEVAGSYLTTPKLTGRGEVLAQSRSWMLAAIRGRGRSIVLASDSGMGRSRVLENIVLEAKLCGARLLRADAAQGGDFGVLRHLAKLLAGENASLLARRKEVELLVSGRPISDGRESLTRAVNEWLIECSQVRPLAIVVDDVHAIDPASLAALSVLSSMAARGSMFLVSTQAQGAPCRSPAALDLLLRSSNRLHLGALSSSETRDLLASMFSEVEHLEVLSAVLYGQARGNPSLTVQGAQALVDADVLRYSAGAWSIPAEVKLLREALPREQGFVARFSELDETARALGLMLALDVHETIQLPDFASFLDGTGRADIHKATQDLVDARILSQHGTVYTLSRNTYRVEVRAACPSQSRVACHRKLADWYGAKACYPAEAHHAGRAGDWQRVKELIYTTRLKGERRREWEYDPTSIETLERIIAAYENEVPKSALLTLRCAMVSLCADRDEWARALRHLPVLLAGLVERCGLSDYAALVHLAPEERLTAAVAKAEERVADIPDAMALIDAFTELPRVVAIAATVSVLAVDRPLAESLPSLVPLFPLSPAYPLVQRLVDAIVACCNGRYDIALAGAREVYGELAAGDGGLDEDVHRAMTEFATGFVQGIEASMGLPEVLERADPACGRNPKIMARERYAYYLAIGDAEMAASTQRELERFEIEGGGTYKGFPTNWEGAYSIHALTGNLHGLKRCERQAKVVAVEMPHWQMRIDLTRVAQEICGSISEATLQRASELCDGLSPGTQEHRYAVFLRFEAAFGLGHYELARQMVKESLDQIGRPCDWFDAYEIMLARAEARLGMHDSARERAQRYVAMYEASGVRGVFVGCTYEEFARIGLIMGDKELFRDYAERCAEHYKAGFNPALTARYERLMLEAKEHEVSVSEDLAHAAQFVGRTPVSELHEEFITQLNLAPKWTDRLVSILSMAVNRCGASAGFLYLTDMEKKLQLAAVHGISEVPDGLVDEVEKYWSSELEEEEMATVTAFDLCAEEDKPSTLCLGGMHMNAHLLGDGHHEEPRGCGVLVLASPVGEFEGMDLTAATALARVIMDDASTTSINLL